MARSELRFRHEVIDADPPGALHDIALIGDINGDRRNEIIIGGKQGPPNLFWYANPSWERHDMAAAEGLEAGGALVDIAGSGRLDIVAGMQLGGRELYWFENPPDARRPWTKRVIENRFEKYHDQAVGDVDGDGEPELVFLSQGAGILAYYDIPADPRVEPWPRACFHLVAEGTGNDEGLWVGDVDGDGRTEILAGTRIYRRGDGGSWSRRPFAGGYDMARLVVGGLRADLEAPGLDIVIAEGESNPARLAICWGQERHVQVLRDDLFHPHSLAIADFDGNGLPDIFVAEMGLGRNPDPRMIVFRNLGGGRFEEVLISRGIPTHEAKVGDLTGDGRADIVGKPYDPQRHIDVWFNETAAT